MNSIRIASTQNEVILGENEIAIVFDKRSRLKKPYYMYNETIRDEVFEKYKAYFYGKVNSDNLQFISELKRIYKLG